MSKTSILALILKSIGESDIETARIHAEALCDAEEKAGHFGVAKNLRGSLNPNGFRHLNGAGNLPNDLPLSPVKRTIPLSEVALSSVNREQVHQILDEWKIREELKHHGLRPRNRLFFGGPPGCGKSLLASAIAFEVTLPCYVVRFDSLIASLLGQTGFRLRQLFAFAELTPSVILLDEIDALARTRGDTRDIGEIDRVVISLLQELEHSNPKGFIIATSNIPKRIDDAMWRRFDSVMDFKRPTRQQMLVFAKQVGVRHNVQVDHSSGDFAKLQSYSDVEMFVESLAKRALVNKSKLGHK